MRLATICFVLLAGWLVLGCGDSSSSSCSDECSSGAKRCQRNAIQTCGNFDDDDCLEWGGDSGCRWNESCVDGACVPVGAMVLYVSTVGNDAWSGTLAEPNGAGTDGPLASLVGARDTIRQLRTQGRLNAPLLVLFRQGVYRQTAPVELTPEDSGTAEAPVTFGAYPGEVPVLSGGRELSGFLVRDGKWTLLLSDVQEGAWTFAALWVNGERRTRARIPDSGFFTTAGKADPPNQAFRFHPGDLQAWQNLGDAIVVVYHSWATSLHHIDSLDFDQNIVTFTGPATWDFEYWGPGQRYRVENVPEALDAPGEWYLDRGTGVLSYLPLPGEDPDRVSVVAPVAGQLLVLRGDPTRGAWIQNLKFQDLRFEHTDWKPGPAGVSSGQAAVVMNGAVEIIGARQVVFERCFIGHVGTYGIWWRIGSQDGTLLQSELVDLGGGGVRIGEVVSELSPEREVQRIRVDNCFIHDTGKILAEGVGVWIGRSSYNQITHNEICDLDYSGVSVGWSWGYAKSSANNNLIAHNHIHHLGRYQLNDMGGIYTLGISPGTQILHNHIHDVFPYIYGGWGLYTDEGSSNILLSDNLVYNTKSGGFHQHYGQDNLVYNNILAYSHEGQIIRSREEDHRSFDFQRNIVLFNNAWLLGGNWGNNQYDLEYNLYWDTSGAPADFDCQTLAEWQALGHDLHSLVADPQFADPDLLDFHLSQLSPAIGLGFVALSDASTVMYLDDVSLHSHR